MEPEDHLIAPRRADRRGQHRQRVLKGALVVLGDHRQVFDCSVRDLTERGARITLERTDGIPDSFELLLVSDRRAAPARAVWREARDIGIELTGPWRPFQGAG